LTIPSYLQRRGVEEGLAQAVAVVPGVGRQIIPSDGGDLLHPRYLPLPGRGVAAEGVKHPTPKLTLI